MSGTEARSCIFCGGRPPLTLEHTIPKWTVPLVKQLDTPASATRVSHHEDHVHDVWPTTTVDLKARKVCGTCNSGWMAGLENAARPILTPMILSTAATTLTEEEALVVATWVTKTVLTGSLNYPDSDHPIPSVYFRELYLEPKPLVDSVVWIGGYRVGRYPVSHSQIPMPFDGFRSTGNVGCFAYQVTVGQGLAEGVVLPPADRFMPKLAQIWPLRPRTEIAEVVSPVWPGFEHRGRYGAPMDDDELRFLSQVDLHAWGVEGHERPPATAAADSEPTTP